MTDQSTDTKVKIMEAARILFADHGFEGTSVRDIAKAADVNVASVNYHFSSKDNLFAEILQLGYSQCSEELRRFYDENQPSVEEALIHLFRYFINRSPDLVTYFKMMMSSQHSHHSNLCQGQDEVGPPGGKVIIEALMKETGGKATEEDLHWALKSLFNSVTHTSLMYNCLFRHEANNIPFSSIEDLEKNIRRLTKVVVKELKDS
jgi:AcrR family transcriptional regulator